MILQILAVILAIYFLGPGYFFLGWVSGVFIVATHVRQWKEELTERIHGPNYQTDSLSEAERDAINLSLAMSALINYIIVQLLWPAVMVNMFKKAFLTQEQEEQ